MNAAVQQPTVWLAGDWQHADFAAAIRWLGERARLQTLPLPLGEGRGEGISATASPWSADPHPNPLPRGEGTASPHAILLCQTRPGQISQSAVEQLHSHAPLARLVALLGSWCEGESRSGRPWPGVARVPWRTWPVRLPLALDLQSQCVRLPRTITDVELLQRESIALRKPLNRAAKLTAIVRTECRMRFGSICDALATLGVSGEWSAAAEPAAARCALEIIDGWKNLAGSQGPPRILLLPFPRPDDWARATDAGIAAVLPQPLYLAELAAAVQRVAPQAAARQPAVA